ncbi:MAG: fumarylacetoacetate hydrolase family protein [Candidatus Dormibacteraeota bacterium]|nr:fumarylacetoacetate hydrolase family protein [Candidatus Dormibacteraeota bacterium]
MRVGNVRRDGSILPALVTEEHAYPLRVIPQSLEPELGPALAVLLTLTSGLDTVYEVAQAAISRGSIEPEPLSSLAPPVLRPGKVICVGRNYAEHARETGSDIPAQPLLFAKFASAVIGPFDDIVRPGTVADLDYEGELCVIIGQTARHDRDHALEHVAGYCCANDVSARTEQLRMGDQWLRGKSHDTFCPLGPAIVTPDEVGDVQSLHITTRIDGEVRQDDTTAHMLFDVATLVSYCSAAFTLEPGDILLTGTPPGVALGRTPPPWLQPGQDCEVEIERVGRIANRVVDVT